MSDKTYALATQAKMATQARICQHDANKNIIQSVMCAIVCAFVYVYSDARELDVVIVVRGMELGRTCCETLTGCDIKRLRNQEARYPKPSVNPKPVKVLHAANTKL